TAGAFTRERRLLSSASLEPASEARALFSRQLGPRRSEFRIGVFPFLEVGRNRHAAGDWDVDGRQAGSVDASRGCGDHEGMQYRVAHRCAGSVSALRIAGDY